MPPFDRREFLKIMGAGAAATAGLAACSKGDPTPAEPAASSAPVATPAPGGMPEGFYDLPMKGTARLLHITDVHGQLKPVYFREPNVNLGVGDAFGRPPHLVGKKLLEANELSANTPESYAYTYLDFENAAHTYGMTGGYAHIKTSTDIFCFFHFLHLILSASSSVPGKTCFVFSHPCFQQSWLAAGPAQKQAMPRPVPTARQAMRW